MTDELGRRDGRLEARQEAGVTVGEDRPMDKE